MVSETHTHPVEFFRPSSARLVILFLTLCIILDVAALALGTAQIKLLSEIDQGGAVDETEIQRNDDRQLMGWIVRRSVYWATVVVFLVWIYKAYRNLSALGSTKLRYSAAWAVGAFFVPILQFFRPYQIIREIWKGSDPAVEAYDESHSEELSAPSLIGWWWVIWVAHHLTGAYANIASRDMESLSTATAGGYLTITWINFISDILEAVSAVLAILVVKKIYERQMEKSKRLRYTIDNGA
ncbi:MAG: DUF4328 domain-containing protein [Pseudomonadota bacterium]